MTSLTQGTSRIGDDTSAARFTLHSHHLAKLDRFVAQARRLATRDDGEFIGVAVEIDAAGGVSVHAPRVSSRWCLTQQQLPAGPRHRWRLLSDNPSHETAERTATAIRAYDESRPSSRRPPAWPHGLRLVGRSADRLSQ